MKALITCTKKLAVFAIAACLCLCSSLWLFACADGGQAAENPPPSGETGNSPSDGEDNSSGGEGGSAIKEITLTVGGRVFVVTLADNDTARAFTDLLPLTLPMSELNGNEKYYIWTSGCRSARTDPGPYARAT